ncbi:MAG: peptidoglycan-binding protein [Solirubrobacteraceae bacterium]
MVRLFEVILGRGGRAGALALAALVLCAGPALAANSQTSGGGSTGSKTGASSSRSSGGSRSSSGGAGVSGHTRSSSRNPFGRRTLKEGSNGSEVTLLQFYLEVAGYHTPVSGQFGSRTRNSVVNFQKSYGLRPSGQVGQKTGQALGSKVAMIDKIKPNGRTQIHSSGAATAPTNAPPVVKWIVRAANRILHSSYCYAGGHGSWKSSCYDCSGAVSYALHGAGLLNMAEPSSSLMSYGAPGRGRWVSVYAANGHTFLVVAGRAFDTANFGGPNRPSGDGPRWRWKPRGNLADGMNYVVRHPPGL